MSSITSGQRAALALVAAYTGGTFDLWQLAGDRWLHQRQQIMNQLTSCKVPARDCTVVSMLDAFYAVAPPFEGQPTQREAALAAWCGATIDRTAHGQREGVRQEQQAWAETCDRRAASLRRVGS